MTTESILDELPRLAKAGELATVYCHPSAAPAIFDVLAHLDGADVIRIVATEAIVPGQAYVTGR